MGFVFALVLAPLLILAGVFVVALLLTGVATVLAGVFGGAASAVLVKNNAVKRLLLVSFGILLSFGFFCLAPIIGIAAELGAMMVGVSLVTALVAILGLAIAGVRFAGSLANKVVRIVLRVVFGLVIFADVVVGVVMLILTLL